MLSLLAHDAKPALFVLILVVGVVAACLLAGILLRRHVQGERGQLLARFDWVLGVLVLGYLIWRYVLR